MFRRILKSNYTFFYKTSPNLSANTIFSISQDSSIIQHIACTEEKNVTTKTHNLQKSLVFFFFLKKRFYSLNQKQTKNPFPKHMTLIGKNK